LNDTRVDVKTSTGTTLQITNDLVESIAYCTNQFEREVKMTRTELAQKIEQLGRSAFYIKFRKLVQPNDVADALDGADLSTQAKRRKVVKEAMQGKERVMHARLYYSSEADVEIELGMYRVIDLEVLFETKDEKKSIRMIDMRQISELIVDNVRYYV